MIVTDLASKAKCPTHTLPCGFCQTDAQYEAGERQQTAEVKPTHQVDAVQLPSAWPVGSPAARRFHRSLSPPLLCPTNESQ